MNNDALHGLLSDIADAEDPRTKLRAVLRMFMSCDDGSIRAATARAIHVFDPALAIEMITERLPEEPNRAVRATYRGVIESSLYLLKGTHR